MAQKIEFVEASSPTTLAKKFDGVLAQYADYPKYIVTPIGFAINPVDGGCVLAVRIEATHKTRWEEPGGDEA